MRFSDFLLFSLNFDLVVDLFPLIQTFINAHLVVYLILRRDSTAKAAKKNTLPNVIHLQY